MAFDEEEGRDVAWNQVKVSGLPREEKQRLMTEVEILKSLDHKNIIKLYHSWIVTEKDEVSVNFITEACAQTLKSTRPSSRPTWICGQSSRGPGRSCGA